VLWCDFGCAILYLFLGFEQILRFSVIYETLRLVFGCWVSHLMRHRIGHWISYRISLPLIIRVLELFLSLVRNSGLLWKCWRLNLLWSSWTIICTYWGGQTSIQLILGCLKTLTNLLLGSYLLLLLIDRILVVIVQHDREMLVVLWVYGLAAELLDCLLWWSRTCLDCLGRRCGLGSR